MKYLITTLFLAFTIVVNAQIDTTYVKELPNDKVIGVFTKFKQLHVDFRSKTGNPGYYENNILNVGVKFKYKKVGIALTIPGMTYSTADIKATKAFGLGLSLYPKALFLQLNVHNLRGFNSTNRPDVSNIPVFNSDINLFFANIHGIYLFNSEQLSLRSAFQMINRQQRSAGSFLVSSLLEYKTLNTDVLYLPQDNLPNFTTDQYDSYKAGLGGGYVYTQVFGNFSATGMLAAGAEFRQMHFHATAEFDAVQRFLVSPRIRAYGSITYNNDHFFTGLVGNYVPSIIATDGLNTRVRVLSLKWTAGWRF